MDALKKPNSMLWNLLKGVVALLLSMTGGVYGGHGLFQWYATGQHWANFKGRGEPNNYKLIAYADHPLNLVGLLVVDAAFVVIGGIACAAFIRLLQSMLKDRSGRSSAP
jgi:hypothetical protein